MEISQSSLAFFFAVSALCGAFLGAMYDLTAILPAICGRVFSPKLYNKLYNVTLPWLGVCLKPRKTAARELSRKLALFIHDLLFMISAGAITALMIYRFNDGKWRAGAIIGIIVGLCFYRITFRKAVLVLTEILRFALKCVLAYVLHVLALPIRFATSILGRIADKIRQRLFKMYVKSYSRRERKRLLAAAEQGFLNVKIITDGERYDRRKTEKPNNTLDNSPVARSIGHNSGAESHAIQPDKKRGDTPRNRRRGAALSR